MRQEILDMQQAWWNVVYPPSFGRRDRFMALKSHKFMSFLTAFDIDLCIYVINLCNLLIIV